MLHLFCREFLADQALRDKLDPQALLLYAVHSTTRLLEMID